MGIQTFFSTIRNNKYLCKCISERKSSIHKNKKIAGLFLDFNAIIHDISFKLLERLNYEYLQILKTIKKPNCSQIKRNILRNKLRNYTDKYEIESSYNEEMMLSDLIIYEVGIGINAILFDTFISEDIIKIVYISIDGVPSKGKMVEQISRSYSSQFVSDMDKILLKKYKNTLNTTDEKNKYNKYVYETTKFHWVKYHIQPGTDFMGKLSFSLRNEYFLKNIVLKDFKNKELYSKILLSDFREVGEGEIKILNYIRHCIKYKKIDKDDIISVFSPDADVILLSSLIPLDYIKNIKLFRYADKRKNFRYWVINIKNLKALLFNHLQNISNIELDLEYLQRYIDDLVFIFSVFGDDFIPRIQSYNTSMHFDYIINCYTNVISCDNFMTNTKILTINNKIFHNFMRMLTTYEDNALAECFLYDTFDNFKKWDGYGLQQKLSKYDEYWMIILNKCIACYKLIKNIFESNINEKDVNDNLKILNVTHSKYIEILYNELIITTPSKFDINYHNCDINLDNEVKRDKSEITDILKYFKQYYIYYIKMPRIRTLVLKNRQVNNETSNKYQYSYDIVKKTFIEMKDSKYFNWTKNLNKFENLTTKLGYIDSLKNISNRNLPYYYFSDEIYYGKKFERTKNIYYKKKLNIASKNELNRCITQYLNGLMWVFFSYNDVNNPLMNNWTYGRHNSPLLQDVSQFFVENPQFDMNSFKTTFQENSILNTNQYFTPFHKILYTTPIEGIIKVLPEYKNIMENISNPDLLKRELEKLGINDTQLLNKIITILCNKNFPRMENTAQIVFNNKYNNMIDCTDAMYISKSKFEILKTFHKNENFDNDFIFVINKINEFLKFNDKSLNNSVIADFYSE